MSRQNLRRGILNVDRAAMTLGIASLLSVALAQIEGRYIVLEMRAWPSLAVAIGLGACAVVAGLTRQQLVAAATGAAFVAAAIAQVPVWGGLWGDGNWLGGNGATASLWLGLGFGLVAVGLADRLWPDPTATSTLAGKTSGG